MKVTKILRKLFFNAKPKLQETLLKQALLEEQIVVSDSLIKIDHDLGKSYIGEHQLGIIYPRSFIDNTESLATGRTVEYYFNGFEGADGGRRDLLSKYDKHMSKIIFSREGRKKKQLFNEEYYCGMNAAQYGLCPHQLHWQGDLSALWTYRFIESCMCGAVPILFRRTPLCADFIDGFHYFWDDETHTYDEVESARNRDLVIERHTLISKEGVRLKEYLRELNGACE